LFTHGVKRFFTWIINGRRGLFPVVAASAAVGSAAAGSAAVGASVAAGAQLITKPAIINTLKTAKTTLRISFLLLFIFYPTIKSNPFIVRDTTSLRYFGIAPSL
jgi:hypothetical protein